MQATSLVELMQNKVGAPAPLVSPLELCVPLSAVTEVVYRGPWQDQML